MTFVDDYSASLLGRPTRRRLLAAGAAGAATLVVPGVGGQAQAAHGASTGSVAARRDAIVRTIGRTGERLPAIGLGVVPGSGTRSGAGRAQLPDVMRVYGEAGGRVVDTSRLYGDSDPSGGEVPTALGATSDLFVTQKLPAAGGFEENDMLRQWRAVRAGLGRDRVDVLQVPDLASAEVVVPMLTRWKSAGRTRYVGVGHHSTRYYPAIEVMMRNFDVDVIQIRYSLLTRSAEEQLLPLAAEYGIGVIVTMPMEGGRLHRLVEGRHLPDWAADFGATTWAQFFLKYVLAHPAVTVVLQSTGNPAHAEENMSVLRGVLPDDDQRARMVEHMAGFAGFARLADG
ncbi:aldo/keto reductase [Micromonospora sp. WMMD558]|uniref:aldo/keto reductase n=1 Tax=Micromonospora sp. WMMD558 TaxID=3403462 RepID=UPI003BF4CB3C